MYIAEGEWSYGWRITVDIHILTGTMLALGMTTRSPRSVLKKKINKKKATSLTACYNHHHFITIMIELLITWNCSL